MKKPINFSKKIEERHTFVMGPSDEEFVFELIQVSVRYNNNIWYNPSSVADKNTSAIWLRPAEGWFETNLLGENVLIIKIDWENNIGTIIKCVVGNGFTTVPNIDWTFTFSIKDMKNYDSFVDLIKKSVTDIFAS